MFQVFSINLGHTLGRAQGLMERFGDKFVSVEHLLLALFDDPRVGHPILLEAGLNRAKVEEAIKVCSCALEPTTWLPGPRHPVSLNVWGFIITPCLALF